MTGCSVAKWILFFIDLGISTYLGYQLTRRMAPVRENGVKYIKASGVNAFSWMIAIGLMAIFIPILRNSGWVCMK